MPWIFGWALIASLGLLSGCVDGNGARYWRLIYWLMGVVEEKAPAVAGALGGWAQHQHRDITFHFAH